MVSARWKRLSLEIFIIALVFLLLSCAASSNHPHGGFIKIYTTAPKGIGYRKVGLVETHLIRSPLESTGWWKKQVESRLRKKARELGADALMCARFEPGSGNASAIAIKYREIFPKEEDT